MPLDKKDQRIVKHAKDLTKRRSNLTDAALEVGVTYNHLCHVFAGRYNLTDRTREGLVRLIDKLQTGQKVGR